MFQRITKTTQINLTLVRNCGEFFTYEMAEFGITWMRKRLNFIELL